MPSYTREELLAKLTPHHEFTVEPRDEGLYVFMVGKDGAMVGKDYDPSIHETKWFMAEVFRDDWDEGDVVFVFVTKEYEERDGKWILFFENEYNWNGLGSTVRN